MSRGSVRPETGLDAQVPDVPGDTFVLPATTT